VHLIAVMTADVLATPLARTPTVTTILGTGVPGYPGAGEQPVRHRLRPAGAPVLPAISTISASAARSGQQEVTTIAGAEKSYAGDGGPATQAHQHAARNQVRQGRQLYIAERDKVQ